MAWSAAVGIRLDQGFSLTSPYLVAPIVLVLGVAGGQALARYAGDSRLHIALALAGVVLILGVLLTKEPGKEPLGYANANAALAVQLVAMCGLGLLATPRGRRRSLVAALGLGVVAVALNRSAAGVAVCLPLVLVIGGVCGGRPVHRWWAVVLGALIAVGGRSGHPAPRAGADVPVVGDGHLRHRPGAALARRRWRCGIDDPSPAPARVRSATPRRSPSTPTPRRPTRRSCRSAPRPAGSAWPSSALVGFGGLLWAARGRAPQAVVAAAAWTALLVHSYADHLLEFAPVVLTAGARPGLGCGERPLRTG